MRLHDRLCYGYDKMLVSELGGHVANADYSLLHTFLTLDAVTARYELDESAL